MNRIDKILFACSDISALFQRLSDSCISKSGSLFFEEGKLLTESRLTPSFQDRSVFYMLLIEMPMMKLFPEKLKKKIDFPKNNHLVQTKQTN